MIVAIDGPAGSGKTTIAKLLSKKLNISYLDTGATYRSLTLKALEEGINLGEEAALSDLAGKLNLELKEEKVYLDGRDVGKEIREPRIDKNISRIVSFPAVREVMVGLQRRIAREGDFVVEGRDITTVVFPAAEYKFFLDADVKIRVERRYQELKAKAVNIGFKELAGDLERRDHADKSRDTGPLKISADAVYIDTTNLSLTQVIEVISSHISKKK